MQAFWNITKHTLFSQNEPQDFADGDVDKGLLTLVQQFESLFKGKFPLT